ncbi:MAG: CBS domain-containing protein [Desulfosarcinaceae bacterium]|jgi:CBS domain-containing protein
MTIYAKDVMSTDFDTIHQNAPIEDAIDMILNGKVRKTGHKTISLIALDGLGQLAGVISMYDILYHLRPDFLNLSFPADSFSWAGQLKILVDALKGKKVNQLMSKNVMSASLDEHIMVILDNMVKNKYRRLPILENNKPIGIIYISDVYHSIFTSLK